MKKGFTLLEMLAVIVVISILSLIILPNITGQFADKKEEISKVSQKIILSAAELYANETGNTYQTITINDLVEAGKLEQPIIDQKTGKEISLTKEISIDALGNACIVGIDGCDRITYKQYKNGEIVYFNPVKGKKCGDYTETNSTTGTKIGCMKWYAFNDSSDSNKVNLLLDHNTTPAVDWNSECINTEMKEVKIALESDTIGWKQLARLITADEIAKITGAKDALDWTSDKEFKNNPVKGTNISFFYFDGADGTNIYWEEQVVSAQVTSKYTWLYDNTFVCTRYGCNLSDDNKYIHNGVLTHIYGYWTSTPSVDYVTNISPPNDRRAWRVYNNGGLGDDPVCLTMEGIGVRPVITVEKYKLS